MNAKLLEQLSAITDEEQNILMGNVSVDRRIYFKDNMDDAEFSAEHGEEMPEGSVKRSNTEYFTIKKSKAGSKTGSPKGSTPIRQVDASLLLEKGRLIDIRPHTRFIHFPEHTHNYVEVVYMCQGSTTHIIDGRTLSLKEGDLLFMNQHARQEVLPAGENDIAVNFIILPAFFDGVLGHLNGASDLLRDFLISCLTDKNREGNYLYYHVADVLPIQNLMENMIWIMLEKPRNRNTMSQQTMLLLFLHLMNETEHIQLPQNSYEQTMTLHLLDYIESEYKDASLTEFAARYHIDIYTLGRLIRRNTGKTFKELLEDKRLRQATYLLVNTKIPVASIANAVGYENTSYFHRLFREKYQESPREYRLAQEAQQSCSQTSLLTAIDCANQP